MNNEVFTPIKNSNNPSNLFSQEMLHVLLNKGLTKASIAENINASCATINRILQGKGAPSMRTFSNILSLYCAIYYVNNIN